MKKINITRIILAGLLASVFFIIIEFIFEGIVNVIFHFNEVDLARKYFPCLTVSGVRYQIVNIIYLICICTVTIWLYASLCPKFGDGPKTAFIASFFVKWPQSLRPHHNNRIPHLELNLSICSFI